MPEQSYALVIKADKPEYIATLNEFLDQSTRPDFEDEVESWQVPYFNALEKLPYLCWSERIDNLHLCVYWDECDYELSVIANQLEAIGYIVLGGYLTHEYIDYGGSAFFQYNNGGEEFLDGNDAEDCNQKLSDPEQDDMETTIECFRKLLKL